MSAYVRVQNKIKDNPFFCKSVNRNDVSEQCMYDMKSKLNFVPILKARERYTAAKPRNP